MMDDDIFNHSGAVNNRTLTEDIDFPADGSPALRILISVVYSVVCAVGLVGNLLVFFLMRLRQDRNKKSSSSINIFIVNLAVTDFQFVLTLPFWAVDTALDFSWPFGHVMCKIILSVTVMNMYASVFFLTAMSVTRYRSVAWTLKKLKRRAGDGGSGGLLRWVCAVLWLSASVATAPTTIFSTVTVVAGEKLCLLRFPEGPNNWLALYHVQKILVAFVIPMLIVCVSYVMLLRFVRQRGMMHHNNSRASRLTKSVTIVVLSFFICWMPNHAITFWGVLVKFNAVYWDRAYYMVHTYVFPLTVCLAHTNSCLNPVLYCLVRREYRKMLRDLFWRISAPAMRTTTGSHVGSCEEEGRVDIPPHRSVIGIEQCPLSIIDRKGLSNSNIITHK